MTRPARPQPTLKAVAEAAGVHASTVSRALDPARRHLIAADLAARIAQIADALGYRPDRLAASLRTGRSRLVGILVPDIANPVFSPIIAGFTEGMGEAGYSAIVADVGAESRRQRALIDELVARRVDGLALATVRRDDDLIAHCRAAGVSVVLVNRVDDAGEASSIVSDDRLGMALAVDHLASLGHSQIGHLGGPTVLSTGALRLEGFRAAMARRALPIDERWVTAADAYSREAGEAAAERFLAVADRPTAIVTANDLLALGLLRRFAALGLSCPSDVSVTGHNDMPLMDQVSPPLTTVRIGPREMGREAARLLIDDMAGAGVKRVMVRPTLVVRGSTAPLQAPSGKGGRAADRGS